MGSDRSFFVPFTLLFLYCCFSLIGTVFVDAEPFTVTILHTNDVHSRFLETNKLSGSCSEKEKLNKSCYGGFSRLHYKVNEIRKTHPNVLYLSGGDYFQGTVWYTLYKWQVVAKFVNQFQHTAMALGNHEFDDGMDGLIPFLKNVTFPIIGCNIDTSKEPRITPNMIKPSIITNLNGRNIGIIGYTTQETVDVSNPDPLIFEDEVTAVTREAQKLHEQGIKIIIAVGHAGYDVDMKIAAVPHVDVVVGGHTNTFLYSGDPPDAEKPLGKYPTIITTNGRDVPVVQAYAFGKYLGYLNVTFDDDGEVTCSEGNPILLDGKIPQDEKMEQQLQEAGKEVIAKSKQQVGKTNVLLDGSTQTCRTVECNLGSLIADAMVDMNIQFADDDFWSGVSMAIINGGSVRSSIDETTSHGVITLEDILTVFPFQNTIDLIEIKGKHLREAFEFAVEDYDPKGFHLSGKFLQISGLRVIYDIRKPNGQRVAHIEANCLRCRIPKYEPLQDEAIYKVAIPTYTANGGDGFRVINNNKINHHLSGMLDSDMMLEYLNKTSPVIQGIDGRIKIIVNDEDVSEVSDGLCTGSSSVSLSSFGSGFILMILMQIFSLQLK